LVLLIVPLVVLLRQDCIARPARVTRRSQFRSASTIVIVIKTLSVGHTYSIGFALQCFVGQMTRSNLFPRVPNHLDLPTGDDFTANQAITLLIQRLPVPNLIESLQDRQFFLIG
jgi:hypothetical protein